MLLYCAILCAVSGCRAVKATELIGTWRADYGAASATVTIQDDGVFVQRVVITENGVTRVVEQRGTWALSNKPWDAVVLKNCLGVSDGMGGVRADFEKEPGLCVLAIGRDWLVTSRLHLGSTEASPYRRVR